MKQRKVNTDDSYFFSFTVVLSSIAVGFMLACVMNPMINHTQQKRRIEPIPIQTETIEVECLEQDQDVEVFEPVIEVRKCNYNLYDEYEIALIAKVVRAEAGNQDEMGKRLIVDVILNRLDSSSFPDTIKDVVEQDNQFASYEWYTDEDREAVIKEMAERTDNQILFFRIGHYHNIGSPAYKHGDHYFSTM